MATSFKRARYPLYLNKAKKSESAGEGISDIIWKRIALIFNFSLTLPARPVANTSEEMLHTHIDAVVLKVPALVHFSLVQFFLTVVKSLFM